MKILIVDDRSDQSKSLKLLLKFSGLRDTEVAASVAEAKKILQKGKTDLVICDVDLGNGGYGPDLGKAFPKVPIMYTTGDTTWARGDRSVTVMYKPYDIDKLLAKIKEMGGQSESLDKAIFSLLDGQSAGDVIQGLVEYKTPEFVQHCVTSVRKEHGYPKDKSFAICYGQRNKGLAKGKSYEKEHSKEHTSKKRKEFEKAIDYKGVHKKG